MEGSIYKFQSPVGCRQSSDKRIDDILRSDMEFQSPVGCRQSSDSQLTTPIRYPESPRLSSNSKDCFLTLCRLSGITRKKRLTVGLAKKFCAQARENRGCRPSYHLCIGSNTPFPTLCHVLRDSGQNVHGILTEFIASQSQSDLYSTPPAPQTSENLPDQHASSVRVGNHCPADTQQSPVPVVCLHRRHVSSTRLS